MIDYIQKRDNKLVKFDKDKIVNAVILAMRDSSTIDYEYAIAIATEISKTDRTMATVEEIQDMVEELLMKKYPKVARGYIKYRSERTKIRNMKSDLMNHIKNKIQCLNNEFSNANVDEESFGARKNEAAGILMKEIAATEMLNPLVKEKWENNELYIHDMTQYAIGDHNCLNIDLKPLLLDGFNTRNGGVRGAKSISTAMQLVAVIFQAQSQHQFGGVGSPHIDYDLAPFVRMSFIKHYADGLKYTQKLKSKNIDAFKKKYSIHYKTASITGAHNIFKEYSKSAYEYALDMLDKEGLQSAQALYHNLNTLESRPGSQLPFSSINFGLNTTFEGRKVIEWLLKASIDGIGKFHQTSIFPISIWQYAVDINDREGTPNYDLFKLSIESTTKRIYPNYVNSDWISNEHDIRPTNLISVPSLDKNIKVEVFRFGEKKTMALEELWNILSQEVPVQEKDNYLYLDLRFMDKDDDYKKDANIFIVNSRYKYGDYTFESVDDTYAKINYISSSKDNSKFAITTNTFNHDYKAPKGKKNVEYISEHYWYVYNYDTEMATMGSCDGDSVITFRLNKDVYRTTFSNAWDKIKEYCGIGSKYNTVKKAAYIDCSKEEVFIYDSFLNDFTKVKKFIQNDDIGVWYLLDFENGSSIYLTADHPLPIFKKGRIFVKNLSIGDKVFTSRITGNGKPLEITKISKIGFRNRYGYDVETVSDHFDVDGLNSHNCRTLIGKDRHGMGYKKSGRGNVAPVTINLAKLGIKNGICLGERKSANIEKFWSDLEEILEIAKTSLIDRYKYISSQKPTSAYFMYDNKTINNATESLEAGTVEPSMKHNTLSIGFVGLSNMLYALFGKYQNEDSSVDTFALNVVHHMYEFVKKVSEETNLNFTLYASPVESSCYTMMTKLKAEYGNIKGVTDHEYLNNSYHIPVYEEVSIKKKIDIESQYSPYCTAGNIQYVEFDSSVVQNKEAVERIIHYAMAVNKHSLAYFAINFPIDTCLDCGYSGEIEGTCPKCGSDHIQRLRRVTGYLTADYLTRFNLGKRSEVKDRVKHSQY